MRSNLVTITVSLTLLAALAACSKETAKAPSGGQDQAMTEQDKTFYALGTILSQNLEVFELSPKELEFVKQGLTDGVEKKAPKVDLEKYGPQIQQLHQERVEAGAKKESEAGKAFLAKAAAEPGAKQTASGLVIKEIKAGTGATPKATDQVKVHYHGTLTNGEVFDSSVQRGEPITFPLDGVIPCWTEGLQLMKVGGKSQLVCPADIAYGDRGAPPQIKPGATLVFDVELLDIVK